MPILISAVRRLQETIRAVHVEHERVQSAKLCVEVEHLQLVGVHELRRKLPQIWIAESRVQEILFFLGNPSCFGEHRDRLRREVDRMPTKDRRTRLVFWAP